VAGRVAPTSPKCQASTFEVARCRGALSHRHASSLVWAGFPVHATNRVNEVGTGSSWAAAQAPPLEPPHMQLVPPPLSQSESVDTCRSPSIAPSPPCLSRLGLLQAPPTKPGMKSQTSPRRDASSLQTNATSKASSSTTATPTFFVVTS
jgi:hypothetical protein